MAKYVGKIFRINNSKLKIRGNDVHYIHVKWFNPFSRKFKCRVITSLEDMKHKTTVNKSYLEKVYSSYNNERESFCILNKKKYKKLRNGYIEPIPLDRCVNFDVWAGFTKTVNLSRSDLIKGDETEMSIKK